MNYNLQPFDSHKEAPAFALLAVQGRPGNPPPCNGARGQPVLGNIVPGCDFHEVATLPS